MQIWVELHLEKMTRKSSCDKNSVCTRSKPAGRLKFEDAAFGDIAYGCRGHCVDVDQLVRSSVPVWTYHLDGVLFERCV